MDKQHIAIISLSVIALIMAIILVMKMKSENFDYYPARNFITTLTQEQIAAKAAEPTCKAALSNFCGVASKAQNDANGVAAVETASLAVSNACGPQVPPYAFCNIPLDLARGPGLKPFPFSP